MTPTEAAIHQAKKDIIESLKSEASLLMIGRAIVDSESESWDMKASEWTVEDLKNHGLWSNAMSAVAAIEKIVFPAPIVNRADIENALDDVLGTYFFVPMGHSDRHKMSKERFANLIGVESLTSHQADKFCELAAFMTRPPMGEHHTYLDSREEFVQKTMSEILARNSMPNRVLSTKEKVEKCLEDMLEYSPTGANTNSAKYELAKKNFVSLFENFNWNRHENVFADLDAIILYTIGTKKNGQIQGRPSFEDHKKRFVERAVEKIEAENGADINAKPEATSPRIGM